ncbi:SusC/RagA family TonB-linked outer membrane protein [Pseudocnuella soli]|uniref:SusC/RagA family TonB-linked outer membrane protein n=1 Tax=Pseudocnuella soli TaxID=2502779 RepID=UPI001045F643|nr:TonB-dependent receptor [Pseudocnuella soli]
MRKLKPLLLAMLLLAVQVLWAQVPVTGRVTDERTGSPIVGATVSVKGGSTNAVTGPDGSFTINAPQNATLVISYVGFRTIEVAASASPITASLAAGETSLDEVVVVGYGTKIKRDVTGAIAKVGSAELANTPVTSFETALQGRAAGVQVTQQNGKLGQGINIRIRGASSVTGGNEPLYVVDGIPVVTLNLSSNGAPTNPLAELNTNDIESIEILKDASSAAIYGSRASNGVVLITTKRGKTGRSRVDFGFYTGMQKPTRKMEFLNAEDYVKLMYQAAEGAGRYDFRYDISGYSSEQEAIADNIDFLESRLRRYSAGNDDYKTYKVNTNWQDQAFQDAPISQYDLSFSGGNERTTFYMGGQYLDQTGILLGNSYKKYNGRLNLDHKFNNWLNLGMNLNFARSLNDRVSNDNAFSNPLQIVALSPITPLIDPRTGLISGASDPTRATNPGGPNTNYPVYYNPILNYADAYLNTTVNRTLGNLFGQAQLFKNLTFRSELGMDQMNQNEDGYYGPLTERNSGYPKGGGLASSDQILNITTNNFFRYATSFAERHDIDGVVGMSYQNQRIYSIYAEAEAFPSSAYKKLASAATKADASSSESQFSFLSYFARANYKFNDKYLLTLSGRFDASSRFGANNRWGFFPAASAGWIVSEEDFLKNSNAISFLKLKASYGLTGNAEIGNFASLGLFSGDAPYNGVPGQHPSQLANPDLKWETSTSGDVGFEIGFLKNRISAEVDLYMKKTKDLLLNVEVPGTSGFASQLRNIGNMENKGIEISINSDNIATRNFRWTTNVNFSLNRNKITNLAGQEIGIGRQNRAREGQPLGVFVAREFAGADVQTGDALYIKNTVGPDGKLDRSTTADYNEAKEVVIGNPNPDFIYGIRNTVNFKGFDLELMLQGVYGNENYAGGGQYMSASASNGFDNQTRDQLAAWKAPGDVTRIPEARLFFPNGTDPSSRFVSDGSFLRVKTLMLGYSLPKSVIGRIGLDRARVYVRGQNLFTFTNYNGWDPEVNADYQASNINQGVDFYSAPQIRAIVFGVNVGL